MYYHILMTENCNSECKYCYEKSFKEFGNDLDKKFKFDFSEPASSQVDIKKLKKFLNKDKKAVLVFYGGEPLLEIEKIKEIMDNIDVPFRMQTNGKLLDKLPSKYINRITKILVSLDGDEERTDLNRGKGTYKKVMENLKVIKRNGYKGEIIARMCLDFPDVNEQVQYLINKGLDSVHWQLDVGFYKFDFDEKKFKKFVQDYNKSISKLIDFWIDCMKKGKVLKLYPFLAITNSLLSGDKSGLRCGAGYEGYAITTNGKIVACPIMNCIEDFYAGNLDSDPGKLKKFNVPGCDDCDIKNICGGRCLYWREAKLWPKEGDELICNTIRHLVSELQNKLPEIKGLIKKNTISQSDFEYEKYFGPEIIP
jgi:uncharacterized protein